MILDDIVAHKRRELLDRERDVPMDKQRHRAEGAPEPRAFRPKRDMGLIAEVKRRSPSKGDLNLTVDPPLQAEAYAAGGADAISVLTDARYFGGSFDDLAAVRAAVDTPVLCKDFILTSYQVYEARGWGADLILLIVAALEDRELLPLYRLTTDLGMTALVEVHDQHDLARAVAMDARVIGINNRDLQDFSVDLVTTEYLAPLVPDDALCVSESGINSRDDVERVRRAGARAVLVGETLMRSGDPRATIEDLIA